MPNAISAHYTDAKLPADCPVDDKIDVFEDWMNGWLLVHAYALSDEAYKLRTDAGFAILMLTTAYFEPIESYHTGRPSHGQSKEFFRRGFLRVFSDLPATLREYGYADADRVAEDIADVGL